MKCIKCDQEATKRWSPDLDINGIGMCGDHEKEVSQDIVIATLTDWKNFEKKYFKNKLKKK